MIGANPGPWVDPAHTENEPWKTHAGIVKFFEFPVPIKTMSARSFHIYWQKHHSPNVMNITPFAQFMRKYNSGHRYPDVRLDLPSHYQQNIPFEGAAEVWLNSMDEVRDWLGHPLYAELIQPDEPRFISQDGEVEIVVTKEERLYEPELDLYENLLTKTYLIFRRDSADNFDRFHGAASTFGKMIIEQPTLKSKLKKLVISHRLREPFPINDLPLSDIDVVLELWFKTLLEAQSFFSDPAYQSVIVAYEKDHLRPAAVLGMTAKMRVVHDEFSFQPSTTQPLPFSW